MPHIPLKPFRDSISTPTSPVIKKLEDGLQHIRSLKDEDPEAAHSARTALYEFALRAIESGYRAPDRIAKVALQAKRIKFKWEAAA